MIVDVLVFVVFVIVGLPILLFAAQIALSFLPRRQDDGLLDLQAPRTVVLVPAHNEEASIGDAVGQLIRFAEPETRVLVIADNCDDRTGAIAADLGAEVLNRKSTDEIGKIFALRHGIRSLQDAPPEVIVVIDADCDVNAHTVAGLARAAVAYQRPVQGANLTDRHPARSGQEAIAIFGNRVTNYVRPLGMDCIGLPCQLMGTGMAFPWELIGDFPVDVSRLAEDRQIGFDLAIRGATPRFVPQFRVTSGLPPGTQGFVKQRTRWEHGHLLALLSQGPRLAWASFVQCRPVLLALAIDLLVLPFALICASWMGMTMLSIGILFSGRVEPFLLQLALGQLLFASLLVAWLGHCRRQVPFTALASLPAFLLSKIPIYRRLLWGGFERRWLRTDRSGADE